MRLNQLITLLGTCFLCISSHAEEPAAAASSAPSQDPALESRLERLERDLVLLQNSNTGTANAATVDQGTAAQKAASLPQIDELRDQIKQLRGEIEQLQFELIRNNERMTKFSSDIEFRIAQFERDQQNKSNSHVLDKIDEKLDNKAMDDKPESQAKNNSSKAAGSSQNKEAQIAYQEAYQLVKDKKHKEAKAAMEGFIGKYPNSDLTPNAYFWLGEIQMTFQDYDNAAVSYLKGYQINPKGSRAPDNLYKLSVALARLDKRKESCVSLNKLRKEFPNLSGTIKRQSDEDFKSNRCE